MIYSVPSRSSADVYLIVERGEQTVCYCKGFQYRGRCAHLDAVVAYKRRLANLLNKDLPPARTSA